MQELLKNINCEYLEKVRSLLKKKTSFTMSGLTNCSKLFLLQQFLNLQDKNIIFITDTEQNALKYQNDLKNLFEFEPVIFPYQDGSIYDTNSKNLYKYARQIHILRNISKWNKDINSI